MNEMTEVGAYEAKTRLPELLRRVRQGQRYRITVRGEPVAELVPLEETARQAAREAVGQMQQLMQEAIPVPAGSLRNWIEEGRD